jgi:hypothetical protein
MFFNVKTCFMLFISRNNGGLNMKKNCWEFFKCGREAGGSNELDCGVCPASTETKLDGVHGGKNGGRACWAINGTFCNDCVSLGFNEKFSSCRCCDFYKCVSREEGTNFFFSVQLHEMLYNAVPRRI